jgi:small subunit ribosomal protein S4e
MSKHIKRLAQPERWKLPRQDHTWGPKPRSGPHAATDSLPLVAALRNLLGVADSAREAKQAIADGRVLVDGRVCRDHRRGLGFMDAVSMPKADQHYRVLYDTHGRIALMEISEDEARWKLVRIDDKTHVRGGETQLNMHDGRNILVKEDDYSTEDVLRIKLPDQTIGEHYEFETGSPVYVTGGTHIGQLATLSDKKVVRSSAPNLIELENETTFQTIEDYVFVVGEDEPTLQIPGVTHDG